jgi:hypothetical protein
MAANFHRRLSCVILFASIGCQGVAEHGARNQPPRPATDLPNSAPSPAAVVASPPGIDSPPAPPDSLLPAPSYKGVPGWLVVGPQWFRADDTLKDKQSDSVTSVAERGIEIFPADSAWKKLAAGMQLTYISDRGARTTFHSAGGAMSHEDATVLRVRDPNLSIGAGWLVPAGAAASVSVIPVRDSTSADGETRTWTAGAYRIRAHAARDQKVEIFAEVNGLSVKRIRRGTATDPFPDSSVGVKRHGRLDLQDEANVPRFFDGVYQFGPDGPAVLMFYDVAYECSDLRVIVFGRSGIEWVDEPHWVSCAH